MTLSNTVDDMQPAISDELDDELEETLLVDMLDEDVLLEVLDEEVLLGLDVDMLDRLDSSSSSKTSAGNPADTYAVFTPDDGDWPLFLATGRPADIYAVLAIYGSSTAMLRVFAALVASRLKS
jgi:hypothetical protein